MPSVLAGPRRRLLRLHVSLKCRICLPGHLIFLSAARRARVAHIVTVSRSVLLVSPNAEFACADITGTDYLYRFSGRSSSATAPQGDR